MDVTNQLPVSAVKSTNIIEPTRPVTKNKSEADTQIVTGNHSVKEIQDIVSQDRTNEVILSVPDKALATAIQHINKVVSGVNVELRVGVHKETNSIIVTLIDKDTQDVILEIPPQKVLDAFVKRMELNGLYVDERR